MWTIKNNRFTVAYSFFDLKNNSSGTPKYILSQQNQFLEHGISYIYVYCIKKAICHDTKFLFYKYGVIIDGQRLGIFSIEEILKNIYDAVIDGKKMLAVHIQHLMYAQLRDLLALTEVTAPAPVYLYLHDYYTVCTGFNLMKNRETYCGDTGISSEKCKGCMYYRRSQVLLPQLKNFLIRIKDRLIVISPSECTAKIWIRSYPALADCVKIVPHKILIPENKIKESHHNTLRLAFLGRPVVHKGWKQWEELVNCFREDERFEFYVLGNGQINNAHMKSVYVSVTKDDPNAMVNALKNNEIDVCFLWSLCPETYSYTCMEGIETGAYIFTNHISGNIADIVMRLEQGVVFKNIEEVIAYLRSDNVRNVSEWKRSHTELCPVRRAEDNNAIAEECDASIIYSDDNVPHYKRFDIMPKWLLTLLVRITSRG